MQEREGVAVVLEQEAHVREVDRTVAVQVGHGADVDLVGLAPGRVGLAVEAKDQFGAPHGRAVVARAEEAAQAEPVEVQGEILEEVALIGVVAVAKDGLPAEVGQVVLQLTFDVGELGVELVFLGALGGVEVPVSHSD